MDDIEEEQLRSVAMQNATSIFLARQRAEQELIRTKEALEVKTAALAQARAAAQRADEAKTRFLNIISHELRTPLGAIGGYAALLEEGVQGELTAGQRVYLERIRHNQTHVLRLVNELLDLAKIESGQFVLKPAAVPVQAVLESARSMIEPQARASQLKLEIDDVDPALCVHADRERVEQILINLLSNAVKFTPLGGSVCVTVSNNAEKVVLDVEDTGVGIPDDKLETVFEAFIQLQTPKSRATGGTGLGLSISRELARAMNGDLTVRSTAGKGSTFTLTLPGSPSG